MPIMEKLKAHCYVLVGQGSGRYVRDADCLVFKAICFGGKLTGDLEKGKRVYWLSFKDYSIRELKGHCNARGYDNEDCV